MRRTLPIALAVVAAAAAGCGGDSGDGRLLFESRAQQLRDDLDAIDQAVSEGDCERVDARLDSLREQLAALPARTGDRLVAQLEEGIAHLASQAPQECEETAEEAEPETLPEQTVEEEPEEEPPVEEPPPAETQPPAQTQPPEQTQPPDGENQEGGAGDESGGGGVPAPEGAIVPGAGR